LNKQNVETRRTNSFLRFALGARSPERKNYFKSKYFMSSEDAKLKGVGSEAVNKTVYNIPRNDESMTLLNKNTEGRAKTSKG